MSHHNSQSGKNCSKNEKSLDANAPVFTPMVNMQPPPASRTHHAGNMNSQRLQPSLMQRGGYMGAPTNTMRQSYGSAGNISTYAGPMGNNFHPVYNYQTTSAQFAYQGAPSMTPSLYNQREPTPPQHGMSPYGYRGAFQSAQQLPFFAPPRLQPETARRGPYPGPQQTQTQRVPPQGTSGPRMTQAPSNSSLKADRKTPGAAPARKSSRNPAAPFGEDDFPTLSSQPASKKEAEAITDDLADQFATQSLTDGKKQSSRKPRYVKYNGFDPSTASSASDTSTSTSTTRRGVPSLPPPMRQNRNTIFALDLATLRPGQIVYIDAHPSISYSGHPALITRINQTTRTLTFYKKCSFHSIGGYPQKYAAYRNPHARVWQERGWLLVEDVASTAPHHDTPVLRLAEGKKMPGASYVDVSGPRRLGVEYFSRFSVGRRFLELWLEEGGLEVLEGYARWYRGANPYPNPRRGEEEEGWEEDEEERAKEGEEDADSARGGDKGEGA